MKIVKVNDNLKINIEHIYSLEKQSNQQEINEWNQSYNEYLKQFTDNPQELYIDKNKLFKPEFGTVNSKEDLEKYAKALNLHIINIIGIKPEYAEAYYIILTTGLKININKKIYDVINLYFEKYLLT